jgi:glycosyltransferase involved in cell wall biosynthesis
VIVVSPHCGLRTDSTLGGEIFERALLERLPDHGVELELGLPRSRPLAEPRTGWNVTLLRPARGLRWWIAPLAFVPYVVRMLRARDVAVLRGHSVLFVGPSLLIGRRLARSGVPIVLHHLHTDPRWAALEHWIARRADHVITISRHSRDQLVAAGVDPSRIDVVFPGVAEPPATEAGRDAWPPSALRLLYLGRLIDRKRPRLAVTALGELRRRGVGASLVVAGAGPLRAQLEELARAEGASDHVAFTGEVGENRKWELLRGADVLLFPSSLEGFGFVAAEAQAVGLAVVAAAGTASEEIVLTGETGFVTRGDTAAFADAIALLAEEEPRLRLGARAAELASRFEWAESARQVAEIYERVAAGAISPR